MPRKVDYAGESSFLLYKRHSAYVAEPEQRKAAWPATVCCLPIMPIAEKAICYASFVRVYFFITFTVLPLVLLCLIMTPLPFRVLPSSFLPDKSKNEEAASFSDSKDMMPVDTLDFAV